ncbi:MAG: hypothetical protein AAB870_01450 [Patescibacteria group bacterium]
MTLPWAHIIPVVAGTVGLVIASRMLKVKLSWYAIVGALIFLEILGSFGVAFSGVVCSLSLLLILIFLFEVPTKNAILLMVVYAVINFLLSLLVLSKFLL